jgi:diaminopimelate epimerase
MRLPVAKAHAYGNDFLLIPADAAAALEQRDGGRGWPELAAAACNRHRGIGADGLILYDTQPDAVRMTLFNADGSPSELSGNGVRCLATLVARTRRLGAGATVAVDTDAGLKRLELLDRQGERYTWRAGLGEPEDIRRVVIGVGEEFVPATVLRVGNPQCVVLGPLPDGDRFHRLGAALAAHSMFPAGTNVEFAWVETPAVVHILIWERGVGPTSSSGTGTCASAVAAAAHGGADREVDVIAPGGSQRVEWRDDGVYLTGWAEIVLEGEFFAA